MRSLLRRELEQVGHAVIDAANGKVRLAMVGQEPPDVVVTELYMSDQDGIEVIREIKAMWSNTRIIVTTGGVLADPLGEKFTYAMKHLGADKILVKPFQIQTLLFTIKAVLS